MSNFYRLRRFGKALDQEFTAGLMDPLNPWRGANVGELKCRALEVQRSGCRWTRREGIALKFSGHA